MAQSAKTLPRPGPGRRVARFLARLLLVIFGPAVIVIGGAYFYVTGGRFVHTDNAYVQADKILVSADVAGRLVEVAVGENTPVVPDQLLVRIDEVPYRLALDRAEAKLRAVRSQIEALRATYREKMAEKRAAEDDVTYYRREFERRKALQARGVSSQAALDEARHNLDRANQDVLTSAEQIAGILAKLGGDPELPVARHPDFREAKAERDRAAYDLSRTVITAPTAGTVTNIDLQPGEYVNVGQPLFGIVASGAIWIEANLKETKLTHLQVGQRATIRVDAYPDQNWRALVTGISAATGAEFALLPPQNATGNWIKVVQRLPVRLMVLDYQGEPPLRAGMSVSVEIDTEHHRTLPEFPEFVDSALAWFGREP